MSNWKRLREVANLTENQILLLQSHYYSWKYLANDVKMHGIGKLIEVLKDEPLTLKGTENLPQIIADIDRTKSSPVPLATSPITKTDTGCAHIVCRTVSKGYRIVECEDCGELVIYKMAGDPYKSPALVWLGSIKPSKDALKRAEEIDQKEGR